MNAVLIVLARRYALRGVSHRNSVRPSVLLYNCFFCEILRVL